MGGIERPMMDQSSKIISQREITYIKCDFWVRRILFVYILGIVVWLHVMFLVDLLYFLPLSYLSNILTVTIFAPTLFTVGYFLYRFRLSKKPLPKNWIIEYDPLPAAIWTPLKIFLYRLRWTIGAILMFGFWPATYETMAYLTIDMPSYNLVSFIDGKIPFIPCFSFLYLTVYWLFILTFLYARESDNLKKAAGSFVLTLSISYTFFLLFPVICPHPDIFGKTIGELTLATVQSNDMANNCFPSTHCAVALLSALIISEMDRKAGFWALFCAFNVGISTVFTKQHFFIDSIAGYALSFLVFLYYYRPSWLTAIRKAQA
jgi:membrane-associated phospholipid phosphatase